MNKVTVTVTNVATFEDWCEWLAKTRGKDARDTFEMQIRKIRPLTYLETYDIFEKEIGVCP